MTINTPHTLWLKLLQNTQISSKMNHPNVYVKIIRNGFLGQVIHSANHNDGTIKLTFENDIYAPSVIKEQFTVKYGNASGMVEQTVTDVEVANNVVTLKIPGLKDFNETKWFTVDIANGDTEKVPSDGIQYKITSVDYENIKDEYKTIGFTVKGMLVDPATGVK